LARIVRAAATAEEIEAAVGVRAAVVVVEAAAGVLAEAEADVVAARAAVAAEADTRYFLLQSFTDRTDTNGKDRRDCGPFHLLELLRSLVRVGVI
jgi:hypothetical protein